jgi:hypothetical protein
LQGWILLKSGIFAIETISGDFSMGVDIVSTPAGNADRPFGNPGVLRGYFPAGLRVLNLTLKGGTPRPGL